MKKLFNYPFSVSIYFLKWLILTSVISLFIGCLSAFFLASLAWVTEVRADHSWLLYFLPLGGLLFGYLYHYHGQKAALGNNLIISLGNGSNEKVPLRMIPLTLLGTISTHLFGGSVGREGTAVQMGGTVADNVANLFHLKNEDRTIMIICGISAGFSSVFGTPLAGTIFAIEVLALGKMRSDALFPAFLAAFFANQVTTAFQISHTHYLMGPAPDLSLSLVIKLLIASILFGITGWLFTFSIVKIKKLYSQLWRYPPLRNMLGGTIVVFLAIVLHGERYLGLSLGLLSDAFAGNAMPLDFIKKLFFTVTTLGSGYQGGEVTPLFEIGATLGSTLAPVLNLAPPFLAALGFIGVFSAATNTPIACFIMGIELFGNEGAVYLFLVCTIGYIFSGNSSIYSAQLKNNGKIQLDKKLLRQLFGS